MGFTSRDMYAEVDGDLFRRALRRSGLSYQELADEAATELRKIARSERRKHRDGVPEGVSKSLIEQLVNARTRTTHELRAVAIERALGVGDGDLFVPKVLRVANTRQRKTA